MNEVTFGDRRIELITRDGELWARASQISLALGYKDASAVNRIYARNRDEFTDSMTSSVKLTDHNGQMKDVRIFSLRGAHLVAMFARTKKAKEFRRWVLDILDTLAKGGEYIRRRYDESWSAFETRKEQASAQGRALAQWRHQKEPLQKQVEYWREQLQLCLPVETGAA